MLHLYNKFELQVVWAEAKSKLTVVLPVAVLEKFNKSIIEAIKKLYSLVGTGLHCLKHRKGIMCFWDKPPSNLCSLGKSIAIGYLKMVRLTSITS
jgi:hypothetical protein